MLHVHFRKLHQATFETAFGEIFCLYDKGKLSDSLGLAR